MLRPSRPRRWRTLAGVLAALLAAPAAAIGSASVAQADAVRQQEQWVLNAMDVAGVWQHTHGSGVTVALIDSGVNGQVSDLTGSVTAGRDFSGVNTPPTNTNWGVHGTWMASLIAGHGHAGGSSGIMGVAPAAKILSIRAVTDQGDPGYHHYQHESESRVQGHLANAINYATSKRVSVISMSLGYQGASLPVRVAISKALAQGIVVVASSGNSGGASSGSHGNAPYSFPADYPGVLGVGAVAQDGMPAGFSSDNLSVQVAAPGVRVPAQGRDGQYWLVSGTSPACALTAGVAALIKSVYPTLAPALVVQAITASTRAKPHRGYDEAVGFGTVDATAALRMAARLARAQRTGQDKIAAALFGGGTAAIPPVPVAPRTSRKFLLDSGIALMCLAAVLVLAFRLIVARKPAIAGVPGGWTSPGAPGGWPGGAPPGSRTSGGWAGAAPADARPSGSWAAGGPADSRASGGWAAGAPADARASGGWAAAGPADTRPSESWAGAGPADARPSGGWAGGVPQAAGPPDAALPGSAASGAGGAWSDGDAPGYGQSAHYWAPGGYKPSAAYPSPSEYGSTDSVQPHAGTGPSADPRPPAAPGPAEDHEWSAAAGQPTGYGAPEGYQRPTAPGPAPGSGPTGADAWPAASGQPMGSASAGAEPWPAASGRPTASGPAAADALPAASGPSTGSGASGGNQPSAGSGPPTDSGPHAGYGLSRKQSPPAGYGPPAGYAPPTGDGLATGDGRSTGYGRSTGSALPGMPGAPGTFETRASGSPDAATGPVTGFGESAEPQNLLDNRAADPPAVDDDTWPSSGQW